MEDKVSAIFSITDLIFFCVQATNKIYIDKL